MADNTTPVLIYAPGLGRYPENTADRVAEVLARTIDQLQPGVYSTKLDATVSAPRGLRVSNTIIDASDAPVIQLFELDYLPSLEPESGAVGPPVVPGVLKSSAYAAIGVSKLIRARRRPAKSRTAKISLGIGFAAAGALIFAALFAIYTALIAMGLSLPLAGVFGENAAGWTFGVSSLGVVITWSALRKKVLAFAATVQRLISFVTNQGATADTVGRVLDDAVDGLRQSGWKGDIHLLGFSFGCLALFESLFPKSAALRSVGAVGTVASLTTIGCPLDLVRLYHPSYSNGRQERRENLRWINIFNAADIFASNLRDGSDETEGKGDSFSFATTTPDSRRYLEEEPNLLEVFVSGRTHTGYWGPPGAANCFDTLVAEWLPLPNA